MPRVAYTPRPCELVTQLAASVKRPTDRRRTPPPTPIDTLIHVDRGGAHSLTPIEA